MLIFGLVLSVFGSIALVFLDQTTPELIEENLTTLRSNAELRDDLDKAYRYQDHLLARTTVNSQVRELVETAIKEGCSSREEAPSFAKSILDVFVERRLALFGIGDEYWNLGVYLYDDDSRFKCSRRISRW